MATRAGTRFSARQVVNKLSQSAFQPSSAKAGDAAGVGTGMKNYRDGANATLTGEPTSMDCPVGFSLPVAASMAKTTTVSEL